MTRTEPEIQFCSRWKIGLRRRRSAAFPESTATTASQGIAVKVTMMPSSSNCGAKGPALGSANCGRKARKKSAVLGLRISTTALSRKMRASGFLGISASGESFDDFASSIFRPRKIR